MTLVERSAGGEAIGRIFLDAAEDVHGAPPLLPPLDAADNWVLQRVPLAHLKLLKWRIEAAIKCIKTALPESAKALCIKLNNAALLTPTKREMLNALVKRLQDTLELLHIAHHRCVLVFFLGFVGGVRSPLASCTPSVVLFSSARPPFIYASLGRARAPPPRVLFCILPPCAHNSPAPHTTTPYCAKMPSSPNARACVRNRARRKLKIEIATAMHSAKVMREDAAVKAERVAARKMQRQLASQVARVRAESNRARAATADGRHRATTSDELDRAFGGTSNTNSPLRMMATGIEDGRTTPDEMKKLAEAGVFVIHSVFVLIRCLSAELLEIRCVAPSASRRQLLSLLPAPLSPRSRALHPLLDLSSLRISGGASIETSFLSLSLSPTRLRPRRTSSPCSSRPTWSAKRCGHGGNARSLTSGGTGRAYFSSKGRLLAPLGRMAQAATTVVMRCRRALAAAPRFALSTGNARMSFLSHRARKSFYLLIPAQASRPAGGWAASIVEAKTTLVYFHPPSSSYTRCVKMGERRKSMGVSRKGAPRVEKR